MGKFDKKLSKIGIISSGYYEMQKICEAITPKLKEKLKELLIDTKNESSQKSLSEMLFVESVIEVNKDDLSILGIIRFGAKRNEKDFKCPGKSTCCEEKEIFATYIVNPVGSIKGQSGIDDEWFFDKENFQDKNLGHEEESSSKVKKVNLNDAIKELPISALDFMLPRALAWVNNG